MAEQFFCESVFALLNLYFVKHLLIYNSGYELFSDQRATGIIQWHQRSVGFLEVES